jgi:hypothetical protein
MAVLRSLLARVGLAFADPAVEAAFRKSQVSTLTSKAVAGFTLFAVATLALSLPEAAARAQGTGFIIAACRAVGLVLTVLSPLVLLQMYREHRSAHEIEVLLTISFSAQIVSLFLTALTAMLLEEWGADVIADYGPLRSFSTAWLCLHGALIELSGLRVPLLFILAAVEISTLVVGFLLCAVYADSSTLSSLDPRLSVVWAAYVASGVGTSFLRERAMRREFTALRSADADTAVQDGLLRTMMPPHIAAALLSGMVRAHTGAECVDAQPLIQRVGAGLSDHKSHASSTGTATVLRTTSAPRGVGVSRVASWRRASADGGSRAVPPSVQPLRRSSAAGSAYQSRILSSHGSSNSAGGPPVGAPIRDISALVAAAVRECPTPLAPNLTDSSSSRRAIDSGSTPRQSGGNATLQAWHGSSSPSHGISSRRSLADSVGVPPCARPDKGPWGHSGRRASQFSVLRSSQGSSSLSDASSCGSVSSGASSTRSIVVDLIKDATVLFFCVANFDYMSSRSSPVQTLYGMNSLYSLIDSIVAGSGVYKVLAIDGIYLCVAAEHGLGEGMARLECVPSPISVPSLPTLLSFGLICHSPHQMTRVRLRSVLS